MAVTVREAIDRGSHLLIAVADRAYERLQLEITDDPSILHGGHDLFDALKAAGYVFTLPSGWTWDMIEGRTKR